VPLWRQQAIRSPAGRRPAAITKAWRDQHTEGRADRDPPRPPRRCWAAWQRHEPCRARRAVEGRPRAPRGRRRRAPVDQHVHTGSGRQAVDRFAAPLDGWTRGRSITPVSQGLDGPQHRTPRDPCRDPGAVQCPRGDSPHTHTASGLMTRAFLATEQAAEGRQSRGSGSRRRLRPTMRRGRVRPPRPGGSPGSRPRGPAFLAPTPPAAW
jgi:hypothetical protein